MALQWQTVNMPFAGGIDTKSDPLQIQPGKLAQLVNGVFTSPGKIRKRNGYAALSASILGGGSIASGQALFARNNELCLVGGAAAGATSLYSYDQGNTKWVSRGNCPSVTTDQLPLATTQYSTVAVDMALASSGLICCVYELYDQNAASNQKQGVGYSIVDSATGQVVVPPAVLDATASSVSPRVIVLGGNFCIYYIQGDLAATADIFVKTIPLATPNAAPSAATKVTSGTTTSTLKIATNAYNFDLTQGSVSSNGDAYISFNNRSDGTTIFRVLAATPATVTASVSVATTNSRVSTVYLDANVNVVLAYATASSASVAVFDVTLVTTVKAAAVVDNALSSYKSITVAGTSSTLCVYIGAGSTSQLQQTRVNTLDTATYTPGTASTFIRSLVPAAKAFTYNSVVYVPMWFCVNNATTMTSPQNTVFVLDSAGNVIMRALAGLTGCNQTITATSLQQVSSFHHLATSTVNGTSAIIPFTISLRLVDFSQVSLSNLTSSLTFTFVNYQYGATALSLGFADPSRSYLRGQIANTIHINGGSLWMYDGTNTVEHGFDIYPQGITVSAAGSGGFLSAGTYQYVVIYEWMDANGQVHRSAPSTPVTQVAVANDKITLTVPTLRVTAKTGILIQIYRTAANGTVFRQISNFNTAGSLYNDKSVDTVSWVDSQSDAAIASNPQPYITGNVLQNSPAPPAGPITVHRNRLFVVDSTNPTQVWYSKVVSPPAPVEFSGFQLLNIDPRGGEITALASLDDKLIVFKKDRIFMVLGQGPDATGGQNDFTDAISVSTDTGCSVPKSLVVVPDGIMFQSPKGIYLLNRALQVSYIGAEVEGSSQAGYTLNQVASSVVMPAARQVRFALNTSYLCVVYDYFVRQWGVFATSASSVTAPPVDATLWQDTYCPLWSNGLVWQETDGAFADPGSTFIRMTIQTGYINFGGLQDYKRLRKFQLVGSYKSAHSLTVAVTGLNAAQQSWIFTPTPGGAFQYSFQPANQKNSAFQFYFEDSPTGTAGESFDLSSVDFEVGLKRGMQRLPASQTR